MIKVIVKSKEVDENTLTKIRNAIKPLCVISEGNTLEIWLFTELSMIHKLVYKIVTSIKVPLNIYISDFVNKLQPLVVNGVYNRNIRLRSLSKVNVNKALVGGGSIKLLCYDSLSKCLDKALLLMKEGFISSFAVRRKGKKCEIVVNQLKPIPLIIMLRYCLKILEPKIIYLH